MIRERYRVIKTITSVEGTLYEGDLVTFENEEANGDWRVKDSMGRIWVVEKKILTSSPVQLSRR